MDESGVAGLEQVGSESGREVGTQAHRPGRTRQGIQVVPQEEWGCVLRTLLWLPAVVGRRGKQGKSALKATRKHNWHLEIHVSQRSSRPAMLRSLILLQATLLCFLGSPNP